LPMTAEIDAFYTHPRFWGRGAGLALMERAVELCDAARFTVLTLWTEERNARPRRFYELYGFRLDGAVREREVHGTFIREVRYLKQIRARL
jgi:GNAT superfamily N-acetyltransferase